MPKKSLLKSLRERGTNYLSKGDVWESPDARSQWPELYALLSCSQDGDVKRTPSKITVYVNQGHVMCCLRCPTEGHNAHLRVDPSKCLFDVLEAHLTSGEADWRPHKVSGTRG